MPTFKPAAVFSLALLSVTAFAATPQEDFAAIAARRDALLTQLQARAQKSPPTHLELLLDEAGDGDELVLQLAATDPANVGGRFQGFAEVPAWNIHGRRDWRTWYLGCGTGAPWRPTLRFDLDAARIKLQAQRLTGALDVAFRLDHLLAQRQPPGAELSWWDRFISSAHITPRKQQFTLDARVRDDAIMCDLVLDRALGWIGKDRAGKEQTTFHPITVRFQTSSARTTPVRVQTPNFNTGMHRGDATGLRWENQRLTGKLLVEIHQDTWMPFGPGKCWQFTPVRVECQLDGKLEHGRLVGTYKVAGGPQVCRGIKTGTSSEQETEVTVTLAPVEGPIRGRAGKLVEGRFAGAGQLGASAGGIRGMLLDDIPPATLLTKPGTDDAALRAELNTLLHQVRAAHLALQNPQLRLADALQQTAAPAPDLAAATPEQLAAYVQRARKLLEALDPPAPLPKSFAEGVGESPTLGEAAMPATEGVNTFDPAGGWQFIREWQAVGPFEQRLGLDHDAARVPEVIPGVDLPLHSPPNHLGISVTGSKSWTKLTCTTSRLIPPWEPKLSERWVGESWFAAARLKSPGATTASLMLEAGDFAKAWVNGKLVWVGRETEARVVPRGRTVVPVPLVAGENDILVRVHKDRRSSWLTLSLRAGAVAAAKDAPPPAQVANEYVFPDAKPPLAWDIARGINVAWRKEDLGGNTRPAVVGNRVYVLGAKLECLDLATGKSLWTRDLAGAAGGDPLADADGVCTLAGGKITYHTTDGTEVWSQPADMPAGKLQRHRNLLLLEGSAKSGIRVLALDRATGRQSGTWEGTGRFQPTFSHVVTAGDAGQLITSGGWRVDLARKLVLPPLDVPTPTAGRFVGSGGYPPGFGYSLVAAGDMLYMSVQDQNIAVRFWNAPPAQLAWAPAWETNYDRTGWGNVGALATANAKYLFTWCPVMDRGAHCPDARVEMHVYDARTGEFYNRRKTTLARAVHHHVRPVIAGEYVFASDAGGGSHGGLATNGQIAVLAADRSLRLLARNLVDLGTVQAPVFSGQHMITRAPKALTCLAVTTPEGAAYQEQIVREHAPATRPAIAAVEVKPLPHDAVSAPVPVVTLIPGRASHGWLAAGPLTGPVDDAAAKALTPRPGAQKLGGTEATFASVGPEFAFVEPPLYRRQFNLQGTGDTTPFTRAWVDPRCCSSAEKSGVMFAVLDNTRQRWVTATLDAPGITQWLNGEKITAGTPLHLQPGLYCLTLRIDPEYHKTRVPPTEVAVSNKFDDGVRCMPMFKELPPPTDAHNALNPLLPPGK